MPTILSVDVNEVRHEIIKVKAAGTKVVARLADRAAYASPAEFQELRSLMTALRLLGEKVDTLLDSASAAALPVPGAGPALRPRKPVSRTANDRRQRVTAALDAADAR